MSGKFQTLWGMFAIVTLVALRSETPVLAEETRRPLGRGHYFGLSVELSESQKLKAKDFAPQPLSRPPLTNGEARTGTLRSEMEREKFGATVDAMYKKLKVAMLPNSKLPEVDFEKQMIVFVICDRRPGDNHFQFNKVVASEDGKRLTVHWTHDRHYYKRDKRAVRVKASEAVIPKGPRAVALSSSASRGSGGPTPFFIGRALVLEKFDGEIQFEEWVYTVPVK